MTHDVAGLFALAFTALFLYHGLRYYRVLTTLMGALMGSALGAAWGLWNSGLDGSAAGALIGALVFGALAWPMYKVWAWTLVALVTGAMSGALAYMAHLPVEPAALLGFLVGLGLAVRFFDVMVVLTMATQAAGGMTGHFYRATFRLPPISPQTPWIQRMFAEAGRTLAANALISLTTAAIYGAFALRLHLDAAAEPGSERARRRQLLHDAGLTCLALLGAQTFLVHVDLGPGFAAWPLLAFALAWLVGNVDALAERHAPAQRQLARHASFVALIVVLAPLIRAALYMVVELRLPATVSAYQTHVAIVRQSTSHAPWLLLQLAWDLYGFPMVGLWLLQRAGPSLGYAPDPVAMEREAPFEAPPPAPAPVAGSAPPADLRPWAIGAAGLVAVLGAGVFAMRASAPLNDNFTAIQAATPKPPAQPAPPPAPVGPTDAQITRYVQRARDGLNRQAQAWRLPADADVFALATAFEARSCDVTALDRSLDAAALRVLRNTFFARRRMSFTGGRELARFFAEQPGYVGDPAITNENPPELSKSEAACVKRLMAEEKARTPVDVMAL